jgi:hypothetical protein
MRKLGVALLTTAALSVAAATSAEARGFGGFQGGGFGGFHGGAFGGFRGGGFRGSYGGFHSSGFGSFRGGYGGYGGFHRGFGFHRRYGGFGAGLFAGSLIGAYGYPYDYGYPTYGYYLNRYPSYGYFPYSYPAQRVVIVRRPRRVAHTHRSHRMDITSPRHPRGVHARFTPSHRVAMARAR